MLNVLLVDDEPIVRVAIKSLVEWEKHGFHISGEAFNGLEALKMMEQTDIELLITDIKMPFMDGLELIEKAKQINPLLKIIILSSYDEFELVRKGFKLGASDYLLKPEMQINRLLELINRLKNEIDKERNEDYSQKEIRYTFLKNLSALRERFFKNLIWDNNFQPDEIMRNKEVLGINLTENNNQIVVFIIDNYSDYLKKFKENEIQLFDFSVKNVVNEVLGDNKPQYFFNKQENEYILIMNFCDIRSENKITSSVNEVCTQIRDCLRIYLGISLSIGISNIGSGYNRLFELYNQARTAAKYRLILGRNRIIRYNDIKNIESAEGDRIFNKNLEDRIFNYLVKYDEYGLKEIIEEIRNKCTKIQLEQYIDMRANYLKTIFNIFAVLREQQEEIYNSNCSDNSIFGKLIDQETFEDITTVFESALYGIILSLKNKPRSSNAKWIGKARRFIEEHYSEDISLSGMAQYVNMSETYFSKIFLEETGENFVKYLNLIRIEKAKKLLKETNLKAYIISSKVGYSNPEYFFKVFKKIVGKNVKEYKEAI